MRVYVPPSKLPLMFPLLRKGKCIVDGRPFSPSYCHEIISGINVLILVCQTLALYKIPSFH